jgi:hypothetical protein
MRPALQTPSLDHLSRDDFKHVYEPAEDTFLLLDVLEAEQTYINGLRPLICMEIGYLFSKYITYNIILISKQLWKRLCYFLSGPLVKPPELSDCYRR